MKKLSLSISLHIIYASALISVSPSVGFLLNYNSITAFSLISLKPNHSCTNNRHFVIDCINAKSLDSGVIFKSCFCFRVFVIFTSKSKIPAGPPKSENSFTLFVICVIFPR